MDNVDISVVIPLFNKRALIGDTLDTVLDQTLTPLEILVIDDGSDDGGPDLVLSKAAAPSSSRIRLIRKVNGGVSSARNRGLSEARGDFIAFLDGDDLWTPDFLAHLREAVEASPGYDAAFGGIIERGLRGDRAMLSGGPTLVPVPDYPAWFMTHRGYGLWSSNSLVRRSLLMEIGGFPEGVQNGEDTDTWFRLGFVARLCYVPSAIAIYRKMDEASLSRKFPAVRPIVLSTLSEWIASGRVPERLLPSTHAAMHYFTSAYALALAQAGRRLEAFQTFVRARPRAPGRAAWLRALAGVITGR